MGSKGQWLVDSNRDNLLDADVYLQATTEALAEVTDTRIRTALSLIGKSLAGGASVSTLATCVGLSRSRFEHLFKAQTGTTFRAYLRLVRLSMAQQLLADHFLRIKEISAQCGYAATSNLTREFKREFGLNPSEYRRSASRQQIAH